MKRYRVSIIILTILLAVAAFFLSKQNKGTLRGKNNTFSVSDTSSITKIFFADKNNNTLKIDRSNDGNWLVNDKYQANPSMTQMMLKTLSLIDIKSPVAKSARNSVIRRLSAKSVKVEIYQRVFRIDFFDKIKLFPHQKLTLTYYVGDATQNNSGTFMLMEGSEEPFIVGIPGFKGFVATRYSVFETDWRTHNIFRLRVPEISSVSVKFYENPVNSFLIQNKDNRSFLLSSLSDNQPVAGYDTLKVVAYLSKFRDLNFEGILDGMNKTKHDSLLASTPTYEIIVVDKSGKTHSLKAWKRKAAVGQFDNNGNQMDWDMDRMYALAEGSKDIVEIQYFVFGEIFIPIQRFAKENRLSPPKKQ